MTEPTARTQTFVLTDIEGSTKLPCALGIECQRARGDDACSWQLIGAEERRRLSTGS